MGLSASWESYVISVTSPQTELGMQELCDFISEFEAEPVSMGYDDVAIIEGKLLKGVGKYSEIVVQLASPWQVQFWGGSGVTTISGGSLIGGLGGVPFKATGTAGDITILDRPQDGTLFVTTTSGLTAVESAKLDEFHAAYGLDVARPVTHRQSPARIEFGGEVLELSTDAEGNVIVQRL